MSSPKRAHGPGFRFARESRGWSLRALAEAVGNISYGHLSQIERGERDASLGLITRCAEVLNVPIGLLTSAAFPRDWESLTDEGHVA